MTELDCKCCQVNRKHAIQYTTIHYVKSDGTEVHERPQVCLVCPRCDSVGVSIRKP